MGALPCTIVIVEDDPRVRDLLSVAFSGEKDHVLTACSIGEAEEVLKKSRADLLILDRTLPDGDGLSLCAKIRGTPSLESLPVLMLTGKSETSEKVLGLQLGADDYLGKPFVMEELKARAAALLRRADALSNSSYVRKRLWRY